ncbi:orotate phosphoribosyltransferase [Methanococcoides orientis]|uniref:orotate phosphoribosyltransferase n=1 Tax=Methanococcoides orientis TaxID=2822137 RepID=UPI001E374AE2|nr:orotate phosphoribosyltransferase [Methanococcoides orientis]UGV41920.1 orotate phosphoribosyltransferase [Methanococcoides orientis]
MTTSSNDKEELIDALKACGAVKFGDFTLASGKKSKYYIDIKKASSDPGTLKIIAKQAASLIKAMDIDIVGGVALGGVPIATAVSLETNMPLLLIRKSAKEYGTGGRFVGDVTEGDRIILLEDVTTSGGSVLEAIGAVREAGCIIDKVITVVDREDGATENLNEIDVELIPLVRASDLLAGN